MSVPANIMRERKVVKVSRVRVLFKASRFARSPIVNYAVCGHNYADCMTIFLLRCVPLQSPYVKLQCERSRCFGCVLFCGRLWPDLSRCIIFHIAESLELVDLIIRLSSRKSILCS